VKLAVFDCDGTLVDSQANILRAMHHSFQRLRLPDPDPHAVRRVVGLSLIEAMHALVPHADPALHRALADDYKHAFQRLRADNRLDPEPLFPGIRDLLDGLRDAGWHLAVATGKSDRGLQFCLAHHGLEAHFPVRHTADRHPSKPDPAMLLACLADSGIRAERSAIIGDTVYDIGMGTAAGVRAIGVAWGYHDPAELIGAGAAAVAESADALRDLLGDGLGD
jgi:phosphoglycolate phosphatase